MNNKYDEDAFLYLKDWIEENKNNLKNENIKLIKKIFLEGFQQGRNARNKYNWQCWNQK